MGDGGTVGSHRRQEKELAGHEADAVIEVGLDDENSIAAASAALKLVWSSMWASS